MVEIDISLTAARITRVMDQILLIRGAPERIRVDHGPEFTSATSSPGASSATSSLNTPSPASPHRTPSSSGSTEFTATACWMPGAS